MPDEPQNPGIDATGDAAAPTTDAAVGGAADGEDKIIKEGEEEYLEGEHPLPNMIVRTPDGEELHVFSETGLDDFVVKPSGEIVPKVPGRWDDVIEGGDEFNPPNTMIVRTADGEEVHVFSETGLDDAIIKPSGEIVPKVPGRWDDVIEKQDVVGGGGEAPGDVVEPIEDPAADAVYEGIETPPSFMEDTFEGGDLGDVGEEDVVEQPMDDPVVDP